MLGFVVARALFDRYPDFSEGELSKVRAHVVSRRSCAIVAAELGLDRRLEAFGVVTEDLRRSGNVLAALRDEIAASSRGKLGGLLIRPAARALRERLDPDTYGGAYLLGLRGLVVIAHGNSSRRAIANAIRYAAVGVDHQVVERLRQRMVRSARPEVPDPQGR